MVRQGQAPFLECSSRGDRRFSPLFATVGGITIEKLYLHEKAKGYGSDHLARCREFYDELWRLYLEDKPDLYEVLIEASGLSDMFGQEGNHACQATSLWKLRNEEIVRRGH